MKAKVVIDSIADRVVVEGDAELIKGLVEALAKVWVRPVPTDPIDGSEAGTQAVFRHSDINRERIYNQIAFLQIERDLGHSLSGTFSRSAAT